MVLFVTVYCGYDFLCMKQCISKLAKYKYASSVSFSEKTNMSFFFCLHMKI